MSVNFRFPIGLAALVISLGASAQPTPAMSGSGAAAPAVVDCGKARDPQRCEALQKAKEACKDKVAAEKRKCMTDAMPPMDCSKARNPARCESHQKASAACKDKSGREHRQCMRDHQPKRAPAAPAQKPAS